MLEGAHDGPLVWGSSFRHWLTCSPICVPVELRWGLESNVLCGPEPQTCILLCDAFSTFSMWCWFLLFINIRLTKEKTFLSNTPKKCAKFQTIFYWFKCFSFNVRLISDLQVWVNWYIEFYHAVGILPVLYLGHLQWTTIVAHLDLLDWMISHIFIESLSLSWA